MVKNLYSWEMRSFIKFW